MFNKMFDCKKSFEDNLTMQKKILEGFEILMKSGNPEPGFSEKTLIYSEDKMKVYHYKPLVKNPNKVPTLIIYALVNRETMMDLQDGTSFVQNMLNDGQDLYIIDWGYPTPEDMYLTLEDYIQGYIDNAVEAVKKEAKAEKINILGVCQGGTFSTIYSSLHPEKVNALVTMVVPIDFSTNDGLLFHWGKYLDIDKMVDAYGIIPGDFMNNGFVSMKPISLAVGKYLNVIENFDNADSMVNFLLMERWIFDSPGQAGEAIRQFVNDLYKENKLIKGELMIGKEKVNLKKITMPVLNVYGEKDHIVPPVSSMALEKYVGTKDIQTHGISTGHIGMFVSSKAKKVVAPLISGWLTEKSKVAAPVTVPATTKKETSKK